MHQRALAPKNVARDFEALSAAFTRISGSPAAFSLALGIVVTWAVLGPLFHFSDTWQLVINTGTTIVTFLMVFLIQHKQNKDSLAVQLKLDELVAALKGPSNRLVDVEDLSLEELQHLQKFYERLAREAAADPERSRSIDASPRPGGSGPRKNGARR